MPQKASINECWEQMVDPNVQSSRALMEDDAYRGWAHSTMKMSPNKGSAARETSPTNLAREQGRPRHVTYKTDATWHEQCYLVPESTWCNKLAAKLVLMSWLCASWGGPCDNN